MNCTVREMVYSQTAPKLVMYGGRPDTASQGMVAARDLSLHSPSILALRYPSVYLSKKNVGLGLILGGSRTEQVKLLI